MSSDLYLIKRRVGFNAGLSRWQVMTTSFVTAVARHMGTAMLYHVCFASSTNEDTCTGGIRPTNPAVGWFTCDIGTHKELDTTWSNTFASSTIRANRLVGKWSTNEPIQQSASRVEHPRRVCNAWCQSSCTSTRSSYNVAASPQQPQRCGEDESIGTLLHLVARYWPTDWKHSPTMRAVRRKCAKSD